MARDKYIIGLFDHEDNLLNAVRAFKNEHVEITDALTPFPVHGLEHELGLRDSRLHTAGFIFGITGTLTALLFMTWVSTTNYPINYGGKPFFALPSFIPITFELTVLFASVGMVVTYCIRNGLFPGNIPRIYDDRITDDRFALTFELNENRSKEELVKIKNILVENGAVEIKAKEFSDEDEIFESSNIYTDSSDTLETITAPIKSKAKKPSKTIDFSKASVEDKKSTLLSLVGSASASEKDDLKIIKGIGKVYEGRLNDIGIFTIKQIANLKGNAIAAVEDLTGFPGRVEREEWVPQAKGLLTGKTKAKKTTLSESDVKEKTKTLLDAVGMVDPNYEKDDLKIIKGIGPVYERRLNEIGIFTFKQIANLKGNAIGAVEDLTGFPGRVEREQWVKQAKELK